MQLFNTNNTTVVRECQTYFSFQLPSTLLTERVKKLQIDYELHGSLWLIAVEVDQISASVLAPNVVIL